MTKTKDMIEKVWWAIPPAIIVFIFYPVFITITDGRYSPGKCVFWLRYLFFSPVGRIYVVCTFGFMGIGYYVTRGKTLALRVAIPTILSVVGFFAGIFMALIIAGSEGAY